MKGPVAAVLTLLVGIGVVHAQSPEKGVTVFVTAAPLQKADKEMQKQHETAFAEASKKLKDLEKTQKAQHGNKRDNWPAEAQELYRNAVDVATSANVRRLYEKDDQDELGDSVEDAKKGFTGAGMRSRQENVILVETAGDAQLIVELRGRRSGGGLLLARDYFVLFAIRPGPKLGAERFAAIPRLYKSGRLLTGPGVDRQEWVFEAFGKGSWKLAGTDISSIVGKFISTNSDALTKATGAEAKPTLIPGARPASK